MNEIERYTKVTVFKASERAIELGLIWDDILAQGEYYQVDEFEVPWVDELEHFMEKNYPEYMYSELHFWTTKDECRWAQDYFVK